jgi:hypothetical protein
MAIAAAWAKVQNQATPAPEPNSSSYETVCMLAVAAAAQEQLSQSPASTDIWHDAAAMHMLQYGTMPDGTTAADRSRIMKRLTYYRWKQGNVLRRMPNGAVLQVPPPENRMAIMKQLHNRCGLWCPAHSRPCA